MIHAVRSWLVLLTFYGWWDFSTAVVPRQPIGSSAGSVVADWIHAKSGGSQKLWKYQGALYDPLDGRKVASVEGLEWVSLLSQNDTTHRPIYSQVLQHPNATWNCAATMWSKHVFCYTLGGDDNSNQTTLLRKLRVRPYSPEKVIPLDQAASVYETATTFIERRNGEVLVHSEWPAALSSTGSKNNTIHIWGVANTNRNPDNDGTVGFSVYCKRRSPRSPLFLPDLTRKDDNLLADGTFCNSSSVVVSPKRARWIQFGASNMETKHKFGVRETYSITTPSRPAAAGFSWPWNWFGRTTVEDRQPRLRYTRYGEGPPFYAPGRMCVLELQAEPISSLDEASPVVQKLLKTQVQGWKETKWSGFCAATDDSNASSLLRLLPEPGQPMDRWLVYKGHALTAWGKVRSVTNVVSFFRKEHGFWRA